MLTGGASQLAGVREVAVRVFDRPVRLGRPRRVPHLADAASGPAFCAAAGVLHRAAFGPREAGAAQARRAGAGRQGGNVVATRRGLAARQPLRSQPDFGLRDCVPQVAAKVPPRTAKLNAGNEKLRPRLARRPTQLMQLTRN